MSKWNDDVNEIVSNANSEGRELTISEMSEITDDISHLSGSSDDNGCLVWLVPAGIAVMAAYHLMRGWLA